MNITKWKQIHKYREQTSGNHGERNGGGARQERGLKGTNYLFTKSNTKICCTAQGNIANIYNSFKWYKVYKNLE